MSLIVDIEKNYPGFSLKARFEAGNETLALLGASGCGKSITLGCIAGIIQPDRGLIVQDGVTLFDSRRRISLPPQKREVGLLFQSYALFPNMTLAENVAAGLRRHGNTRQRQSEALELLSAFHLRGLERLYPAQLSGGQQQRAALCRIIASKPKTLLLDEPFAALDSYLKWRMEQELSDMLERFAGSVIYVSHDRDEVYSLSDSVCAMDRGQTLDVLPVKDFFARPETLQAALLSGCKNISRAVRLGDHRIMAIDWGTECILRLPVPDAVAYAGIRARDVCITPQSGQPNTIPCLLSRREESLFGYVCQFDPVAAPVDAVWPGIRVELSRQSHLPEFGSPACLTLPPEAVMPLK